MTLTACLVALALSQHHAPAPAAAPEAQFAKVEESLKSVAAIHGEAGAWAVAGYRMTQHAMGTLKIPFGSFDLLVEHKSPKSVKYACVVDGVQAASGASVGRLQLSLTETPVDKFATVFTNKKTGQSLTLRPTVAFMKKYDETPREEARAAGRQVMVAPASDVFEVVKQP